jgi:hypothetical protein
MLETGTATEDVFRGLIGIVNRQTDAAFGYPRTRPVGIGMELFGRRKFCPGDAALSPE